MLLCYFCNVLRRDLQKRGFSAPLCGQGNAWQVKLKDTELFQTKPVRGPPGTGFSASRPKSTWPPSYLALARMLGLPTVAG